MIDSEVVKAILGCIGVISLILTPFLWGAYIYRFRKDFFRKNHKE